MPQSALTVILYHDGASIYGTIVLKGLELVAQAVSLHLCEHSIMKMYFVCNYDGVYQHTGG